VLWGKVPRGQAMRVWWELRGRRSPAVVLALR
jgi:hypothetical protein